MGWVTFARSLAPKTGHFYVIEIRGHQLKIPVLYKGELDSFLGPRRDGEFVKPSSDEVEQYKMFLHHLLEFEDWRK